MRTLLAALALALALPATAEPAAACGGEAADVAPVRHTATGHISGVHRSEQGLQSMFISYPEMDGEPVRLYGIFVDLRDDRLSREFARDYKRWSKRFGFPAVTVKVERIGNDGAWRLVSYRLGAD